MKSAWTNGLEKDEHQAIKGEFAGGILLRKRLIKMLEDRIASLVKSSALTSNYEDPNWAYKQADNIGKIRTYQEIIGLLDEQNENK